MFSKMSNYTFKAQIKQKQHEKYSRAAEESVATKTCIGLEFRYQYFQLILDAGLC